MLQQLLGTGVEMEVSPSPIEDRQSKAGNSNMELEVEWLQKDGSIQGKSSITVDSPRPPSIPTSLPPPETMSSSSLLATVPGLSRRFLAMLQSSYNPSQLHAISVAATAPGFTLVQGPPGTGKTSTLLGILNSIHVRGSLYDITSLPLSLIDI